MFTSTPFPDVDESLLNEFASTATSLHRALSTNPSADCIADFNESTRRFVARAPDALLKARAFSAVRRHAVFNLLLEDPHTSRAYWKPRGYAGDAVMMDFMYDQQPPAGTSRVGRAVFEATTGMPNAASVRYRRDLIASLIDDVARRRSRPSILSIACGHLREAQLSLAVAAGRFARFYALDQDDMSLEVVRAEQSDCGITTVRGSVGTLVRNPALFSDFDLIYAAGLFDYLDDAIAANLIEIMATYLAPGGMMVIGNFVPSNHGRPYMETIMDWPLILRDGDDLRRLAYSTMRRPDIVECAPPFDAHGNVVYLMLEKRP
jgi:extracellular factor (EF) 3-hydroxypalmitic acid methyl ester biosynthesis protein